VTVNVIYLTSFVWWSCSTMYVETTWNRAFPDPCQSVVLTEIIGHLMCRSLWVTKCVPAVQASFTHESYHLSSVRIMW